MTKILRFFTQGDIDVSGAYVTTYLPQFPQPEIRMMLSSFAGREAVHIAAYSHLIETLGLPETVYNEFLQYEAMAKKHEFFNECLSENELAAQIAAFSAFTEGMQLFSSFVMLLNFPRNGLLKGMGQIIAWSIADETLHTESMTMLFVSTSSRIRSSGTMNSRHASTRSPKRWLTWKIVSLNSPSA